MFQNDTNNIFINCTLPSIGTKYIGNNPTTIPKLIGSTYKKRK